MFKKRRHLQLRLFCLKSSRRATWPGGPLQLDRVGTRIPRVVSQSVLRGHTLSELYAIEPHPEWN